MNQYIISTEAIRDMEQILDYLANTNISTGEKFLEEFSKKCRYLTQFPLMGLFWFSCVNFCYELKQANSLSRRCSKLVNP